ncbi:MAG TPA: hypothetical protein PLE59_00920 [Bacteroidales bacterium]|nr:hypothetical protein [Candidatus Paceibacterota bacterium]HPL02059.1 hypothetical protein [Bacteroidales bacterium]
MNKKLFTIVLLIATVFYLVGCDRNLNSTWSIESSLYNVQEVVDDFKSSEAKYAVEINKEENQWVQHVYIWNNELRRDLRNDLIQIVVQVNDSINKTVSFEFGDKIVINNKYIEFDASSDLTEEIIGIIFPKKFSASLNDFWTEINYLIIRLETLEYFGDTEVINIQIKTTEELLLYHLEKGKTYYNLELNLLMQ